MSQDHKRESIIEAAVKRFAHFGVPKTTMSEIAADLSISKALLYYYFPDKLSLYVAVFKSVTELDSNKVDEVVNLEKDPLNAIQLFLENRTELIIKYHNILQYLKTFAPQKIPKELEPVFATLNERELKRITSIIQRGNESGYFKLENVQKSAALYFEFLEGFRYAFFARNPNFFPDKKQFQAILKREKEFSVIFFNGLKKTAR